jgi:protein transport protein SEC24
LFQSTLPNLGNAKLNNREAATLLGTDKEVSLLRPIEQFYKNFALDCSRQQISVDIFIFPTAYIDIATLGIYFIY